MSWIAEDVPWYQVDQTVDRPWRDEDVAMSSPIRHGEFATEGEARKAVADKLREISTFNFVVRGGSAEMYRTAAAAITLGVDGVRIAGRFHRVREV